MRTYPVGSEENTLFLGWPIWSNDLRRYTSCHAIDVVPGSNSQNVYSICWEIMRDRRPGGDFQIPFKYLTLIWQFRQKICMFESLTMLDLVICFDGDSVVVHKRETHLKWRHEILKTKFSLYSTKIFREMWKLLHLCHKQACTRYRDLV